jgi:hypothetical protein
MRRSMWRYRGIWLNPYTLSNEQVGRDFKEDGNVCMSIRIEFITRDTSIERARSEGYFKEVC